jgi:PIN domain nuclease of toxin-antitoxin system
LKILLDTSVLLNWLADAPSVSGEIRRLIESERNSIFVSPLSVWEARIKHAKGKLRLPENFLEVLMGKDFSEIRFTLAHADEAGKLPMIHADPFDRGLIAQARVEGLFLLTNDRLLVGYDASVLLV